MAEQIIKQPDGRFAVFSSFTDTFIAWDATPEEIVEWRMQRAAAKAQEDTLREMGRVQSMEKPYAQFTLDWDRAIELNREHGGEEWPLAEDAQVTR